MYKIAMLITLLILTQTVGYASAQSRDGNKTDSIAVSIINAEKQIIGKAILTQQADNVSIHVEAEKLPPGYLAIHIHESGKCEAPKFESAGAHFNPLHKQHGFKNPKGFHSGDLPNVKVDASGKAVADIETANVTLRPGSANSLIREGGTSLVIHEQADDYFTDPAGNAGARIACGVIE